MAHTRQSRKTALSRLGVSQRTVAKRLGVDVSLVCLIMAGRRRGRGPQGRRVAEYIALLVGEPVKVFFPRFGVWGPRKTKSRAA